MRLYIHEWLFPAFQSTKPQLFFMTSSWPLHAFKTSTTWESLTYTKFGCQHERNLGPVGLQFLCAETEETLPRQFHFNDFDPFLITADFLPVNLHQFCQQSKGFT